MTQLRKALIRVDWYGRPPEDIEVQYNPGEYTIDKQAQYGEVAVPGLDSPLQQFVRGQTETLTMDLFFDTTDHGMGAGATSVTTETDKIYQLIKIEPRRHAPPILTFVWADQFPGSSIGGAPGAQASAATRAVGAVGGAVASAVGSVNEQLDQLQLSSPDRTHVHVLQQGDSLASVSRLYYDKPSLWREVAAANGIDDARRLQSGRFLRVPKIR